jgi:hypothetical protein
MGDERKRRVIVFFTANLSHADEWEQRWEFNSFLFVRLASRW